MSSHSNLLTGLNDQLPAPVSPFSLVDIAALVNEWPEGATAVTQQADGELLYWDAPAEDIVNARRVAGRGCLLRVLGISHQIHSAYCNIDSPLLACDWESTVVIVRSSQSIESVPVICGR